jgi:hypothetical protein
MGFSNGSAGSIAASSDVALNNILNKDTLYYDTATAKWKNSPDMLVTFVSSNFQTNTTYTLVLSDAGKAVERSNAAANSVTIPHSNAVPFADGTIIEITQMGVGQTSIVAATNVILRAPDGTKLAKQYTSASLRYRGNNEWLLAGNVVA